MNVTKPERGIFWYIIAHTMHFHGLSSVLLWVLFIFADGKKCQFGTVPVSNSVYHVPSGHMPSMNFNTRNGYVSATQNWLSPQINCHNPQVYAQNWKSPITSDGSEFRLTGNISVCNGCKNKFDKTASPLAFNMKSSGLFLSPAGLPESRYGDAYYHANPACIMKKWPHFNPSLLVITSTILPRLLPQHKSIISSLLGVTLG